MDAASGVLRTLAAELRAAQGEIGSALETVASLSPLDLLLDPTGAQQRRVQAAHQRTAAAHARLEEAMSTAARKLRSIGERSGLPPPQPVPCAPPPPPPDQAWWQDLLFGPPPGSYGYDPRTCEPLVVLEAGAGSAVSRLLARLVGRGAQSSSDDILRALRAGPERLQHTYKHAEEFFGVRSAKSVAPKRALTASEIARWERMIARAAQSQQRFPWTVKGTPTTAHLARIEGVISSCSSFGRAQGRASSPRLSHRVPGSLRRCSAL